MELYKEILIHVLESEKSEVFFPNIKIDVSKIIQEESYKALKKIRDIIHDENLTDKECFQKIEEIICVFEALGSDGGIRHDF